MSKLDNPYMSLPSNPPAQAAATQAPLPPPFQEADFSLTDGGEVVYPHYGEEHPPEFTPYEAESFTTGDGHVVSHDPHLNEDGTFVVISILCTMLTIMDVYRRSTVSFLALTRLRPSCFYLAHQGDTH